MVKFRETPLSGAVVVSIEPHADIRGYFARTWCAREYAARGLPACMVQTNISHNRSCGTVRGMHLQLPPSLEAKLVSCTRGAIYDVIVDLRPDSPTYMQHFGIELKAETREALFVPPLFAHGFQTLRDSSEVLYQMTDYYSEELTFGARWNDPAFAIRWPISMGIVILPRDNEYPDFDSDAYRRRVAMSRDRARKAGAGVGNEE